MNTLVTIANTDITPYIDWNSYKMEQKPSYESWKDGNYIEHRIYVRTRLEGSFKVWLCGMPIPDSDDKMDSEEFLGLVASATANYVTTLSVFDQTSGSQTLQTIQAYLDITPGKHKEMINGEYYETFTIKVTQK